MDATARRVVARPLIALVVLVVAGCVAEPPADDLGNPDTDSALSLQAIATVPECVGLCYEPTIASDSQGRIYVTEVSGTAIHVSTDGGSSFQAQPPPPHPRPITDNSRGDSLVYVDHQDRLWFLALAGEFNGGFLRYRGVQVASSSDQGATWDTNVLISRINEPGGPATFADRPWIAVAPDGTVYVTFFEALYMGFPVSLYPGAYTLQFARSDDDGRSFSAFREIDGLGDDVHGAIGGPPAVDDAGRLAVPYLVFPSMLSSDRYSAMRVAVSDDRGETFASSDLLSRSEAPSAGSRFPALAGDGAGLLVAAWNGPENALLVSRSADAGATWEDPQTWNPPNTTVTASPWVDILADGTIAVAWFAYGEQTGTADVRLTFDGPDGRATLPLANGTQGLPFYGANTDLAHFSRLPDGRLAIVWSDQSTGDAYVGFVG